MRSFARPSFFRTFELLLSLGNPGLKLAQWKHEGIEWERHKHSLNGPSHRVTIDTYTLTRPGQRGWSLLVAKEYWWLGKDQKPVKASHWAKPIQGQGKTILQWFRTQERALDRMAPRGRDIPSYTDEHVSEFLEEKTTAR